MSSAKGKIHFAPIDKMEVVSRFRLLSRDKLQFKIWSKGDDKKYRFDMDHYYDSQNIAEIKPLDDISQKYGPKILIGFEVSNVQYFGEGEISYIASKCLFKLTVGTNFFRCEKRVNYRLLVFPIHTALAYFDLAQMPKYEMADVIDIGKNVKLETKGEILNFEEMVQLVEEDSMSNPLMCCRIEDISVGGMAIHVGTLEFGYFKIGESIGNIVINFNGEKFNIPDAKVAYIIDYEDPNRKTIKLYKIGIEFLEVSDSLDNRLSIHIAKELRGMDLGKDFEDFVK